MALIAAPPASAQSGGAEGVDLTPARFAFSPGLAYDAAIPSPAEHLGYELGTAFTLYAHVAGYLEALAEASERVTMQPYGETFEGRPLYVLVVTAPENHARIEAIKAASRRLADPDALAEEERERLLRDQPVVTSFSFNIHGNEASSTEAAMQLAYRLAAATDAETERLLRQSVVVMYPCVNPDGRDRYVYWYKSVRRAEVATFPHDLAHDAPWPGGRTNHYLFDLNRDWVWGTQPEMRSLTAVYQEWMPQVHADYHEQGYNDNYFTMPGTTPRNLLLPGGYEALTDTFGRANIRAFDEVQIGYATREAFDFFYPSYGSSYPSVMGGIGMLTEQGGIGAGRAVETDDGYVLTLRQRIFDHYTTALATIRTAVRRRAELMRYFHDAHAEATNTAEEAAYLFPDDGGAGYLYDVLAMLRRHGVRVERVTEDFEIEARSYRDGSSEERAFEAGAFVVRAGGPRHLFVNSVMQQQMQIEDSVMYDMSSWAAPLAYNLDAYATRRAPRIATEPVAEAPAWPAGVTNADARYAYVIEWQQRHAPRALALLWQKGYRVRTAAEPFSDGERAFGRGTLVVLLGRNQEKAGEAAQDMRAIADSVQVRIVGMDTGRMAEGMDLASRDSRPLKKPRVALMVDAPFSAYTSGQLWHLFDQETRFPIERIRASMVEELAPPGAYGSRYGRARLQDFDVVVLPGVWGSLEAAFDSSAIAALRRWVEAGGTLVATENSARFLTKGESGFTDVALAEAEADEDAEADSTLKPSYYTRFEAREDSSGLKRIAGAAFNGRLDASHPLAFGLPERVYSMKLSEEALRPSDDLQTVGYYPQDAARVLASGYASQENIRALAGMAFAAVRPMGAGRVVFLVDNTQYRAFWRGPSRLMQNAVMLVPSM